MSAHQDDTAGTHPDTPANADAGEVEKPAENALAGLGLPAWLEDMMAPGVGQGVFITLKLSLVGLILCLLGMLSFVKDPEIRIHLYVFLAMSAVLMVLIIWFVGELQSAQAAKKVTTKQE